MNIPKLKEAIDTLRDDLGEGMLATDIFSKQDGQSVEGYNSQPAACAPFLPNDPNIFSSRCRTAAFQPSAVIICSIWSIIKQSW